MPAVRVTQVRRARWRRRDGHGSNSAAPLTSVCRERVRVHSARRQVELFNLNVLHVSRAASALARMDGPTFRTHVSGQAGFILLLG